MTRAFFSVVLRPVRLAVAAAALAVGPAVARAHHELRVDVYPGDPCLPPVVVEPRPERVWVGPTYQTVTARVWVEPTTTSAVPHPVLVPDEFGWQRVVGFDRWGRPRESRQWVVVRPAHYEDRCDAAVVTPGHYVDVQQQQLVCDGHWAVVDRQERVDADQWVERVDAGPVRPRHEVRIRLPF